MLVFGNELDGYVQVYNYVMQSASMVGFGDERRHSIVFHMSALVPLAIGIKLLALIHMIVQEWMTSKLGSMTNSKKKKKFEEQTLEELMAPKPGEQVPTAGPLLGAPMYAAIVPPSIGRGSSSSTRQYSLHIRPFSVSKVRFIEPDDEIFFDT